MPKITALTALASGHANNDLLDLVDVSDTTMAVTGTNKKTTIADLLANNAGGAFGFTANSVTSPSNGFSQPETNELVVRVAGTTCVEFASNSVRILNGNSLGWAAGGFGASTHALGSPDTTIGRAGANAIIYSGGSVVAGAATSTTEIRKAVTAIADNVATATLTVTIPNGAHSGVVYVTLIGSLGAGGTIGANEATGSNTYLIPVTRTTGVNAVAGISAALGTASSSVAGGATITVTGALSAISGAVGVANTFTINITVARGTGTSTNHTALCYARVQNANASGITIS